MKLKSTIKVMDFTSRETTPMTKGQFKRWSRNARKRNKTLVTYDKKTKSISNNRTRAYYNRVSRCRVLIKWHGAHDSKLVMGINELTALSGKVYQ